MDHAKTYAHVVARVVLGLIFVISGLAKLQDVGAFTGLLTGIGLPAQTALPLIAFEIIAGAAVVIGYRTRIVAILLVAMSVSIAAIYHFDPANQGQMTLFIRSLGLAAGFLLLFAHGGGKHAIRGQPG